MRKVKNKKVLRRIADRTRKSAKGRNLVAVLAIALTALLFTTLFTVGGSMVKKQQEATMRQVGGSAHAGYKYLTQAEYDIVKQDTALKEISYRITVGDVVNEELKKLHTEVSYYEDLEAKMSFCYPEVGELPRTEDEVAASDLVLKALGIPCELGAEVPLVLQVGDQTYEKTFTLSGYFPGDSISMAQIVAVSRDYANEVAPTPTESAMDTYIDVSDYPGRIMADFNFASSFDLEGQLEELTKRCGFSGDISTGVNWAYLGSSVDMETVLLVVVLLGVILISGYLIIYNIFYINVFHDIRHYGLLKTLGATGRQLRRLVRRQALVLSLYGIPIGLIAGAAAGSVVLPLVMSQLSFSGTTDTQVFLNPGIFVGAALFSLATVYISCIKPCRIASRVTPVEAVRYTEVQSKGAKKKRSGHVSPRRMAFQNIRRNRKKVVIVVASLTLSLVLLNSIFSLTDGFDMDKYVAARTVSDFAVSDATLDNTSVSMAAVVTDGVTKEFQAALDGQAGIEEVGNVYYTRYEPKFTDGDYAKLEERIFENPGLQEELDWYNQASEDGNYIQWLRENRQIDGNLYGISRMVMEKLENVEGTLDWEKFRTGNYIISTRMRSDVVDAVDFFLPGETVTVWGSGGETKEYEVLAVADLPYSCRIHVYGMFDCDYILPEEEYRNLVGESQPMRTLFDVEEAHETEMEEWLSSYCETVETDLTYTSKEKFVAEFASTRDAYAMVGGLLSFVLGLIGVLNFINTMVTSILSRRQEFAMMEAVGMTGRQLRDMLAWEGLAYALYTILLALLVSALLNATVIRGLGSQLFFFTWHFTVTPVLVCIPLLLLVVVLAPTLCCRSMCRVGVVERMRRVE